jgi:hypothetical protein
MDPRRHRSTVSGAVFTSFDATPSGQVPCDLKLDSDLTIARPAPEYTAHLLVDNLKDVYAGCGLDSYTP